MTATFEKLWDLVIQAVEYRYAELLEDGVRTIIFVREHGGQIAIYTPSKEEERRLRPLAHTLEKLLGPHAYREDFAIFEMDPKSREAYESARKVRVGEIELVLCDFNSLGDLMRISRTPPERHRWTLLGFEGGLGRSTAIAVWSRYLAAKKGLRVLAIDMDWESPALFSMLPVDRRPLYGMVEWMVEDLVNAGDWIEPKMIGSLSVQEGGEVLVVPAYGTACQERIFQQGRAYLDKWWGLARPERAQQRVLRLIRHLEKQNRIDVTLIDTHSGFYDSTAIAISHLGARVLVFLKDTEQTWSGFRALLLHWKNTGVIDRAVRRLVLVAALTPPDGSSEYLERIKENARELLTEATVRPDKIRGMLSRMAVIYYSPALTHISGLYQIDDTAVASAYSDFFRKMTLPGSSQ